jgi:hypothetical protein
MDRLETLSPGLARKLRRASAMKQREAAVAASEFAIIKSKLEHPLVDEARRQLRTGHIFARQERAAIDALAAQLDDEYLDSKEAAEVGAAPADDYLRAFAKARTVAALSFAGSDAPDAAADSIYEAAAAVGDEKSELFSLMDSVLR